MTAAQNGRYAVSGSRVLDTRTGRLCTIAPLEAPATMGDTLRALLETGVIPADSVRCVALPRD